MQSKQLSGTALESTAQDKSRLTTYVSPEEYERMSPAERERLHAAVGAEVTVPVGHNRAPAEPISHRDLDEAMRDSK